MLRFPKQILSPMIWFISILLLCVVGWYWFEHRWNQQLFSAAPGNTCVNIHPPEARAFLEQHPETQVLDVRSQAEFSGGAIPGAVHISIGDDNFAKRVGELDREKPVLVYCAGGYRSRKAVEVLKALEFKNIQHLHRGYMSWK